MRKGAALLYRCEFLAQTRYQGFEYTDALCAETLEHLRHAKMASELRMQGWPGEARQIQGDPQLVVGTIWLLHIQVDTSGTQTVVHWQRQTREYN